MDPLRFAISQYVVCCRIEQIHDITMKFIQEMVTDSTLWDALPDPFAMYIDGRTWNHYIHSVIFRASHVTPFVSLNCMLSGQRVFNGVIRSESLSDVSRATKRLRVWTNIALQISACWRFGVKMSMPSPVDTQKSKRMWEREIYQVRRSFLLLKSISQEIHNDIQEVSEEHFSGEVNHNDCDLFLYSETQHLGDYTGGATDGMPCAEIIEQLPAFYFNVQFLKALACTCKSLLAVVRSTSNWTDRTVHVNQLWPDDGATFRTMTRLLTSARAICVNLSQVTQFSRIPYNARLCWTVNTTPVFLQESTYTVGFRSEAPLMGMACFNVHIPIETCGIYIGVEESSTAKRSYCRIDNIGLEDIAWSFGLDDIAPVLHRSASRHRPLLNQRNTFGIRWNQKNFFIALNNVGVSSATLRDTESLAAEPLSHVFMWIFCRQRPAPLEIQTVPSPIDVHAVVRCAICKRDYNLSSPHWRMCSLCHTWICEDHKRLHPERLCPHCVMQLGDYIGGSTNFFPIFEESPVIYTPGSSPRVMRLYRLWDRSITIMRLLPNEIPFEVMQDAFDNATRRINILAAVPGDEIKTLLFMAVPELTVREGNLCYCLFIIGQYGLDQAVVVPFLPRPSWDGLWLFLEIAFGFSKLPGSSFEIQVNDFVFTENDDIAWLPSQCLGRLLMTSPANQQFALPPFNGTPTPLPRSQEEFLRLFRSEWTADKIYYSNLRGVCNLCRKPLVESCPWRELAIQGRLGFFCSQACAIVQHTFRVNRRGVQHAFQATTNVPACVHPRLLELYHGIKYAFGHEARRFQLLPGTVTGHPTWIESDGVRLGCSLTQDLPGDVLSCSFPDYSGGSTKATDEYILLTQPSGSTTFQQCMSIDRVRLRVLYFLARLAEDDAPMVCLPSHSLYTCANCTATPVLLHPQPVRFHHLPDRWRTETQTTSPAEDPSTVSWACYFCFGL